MKGDGAAPGLGPNVKHPLAGPFLSVVPDVTAIFGLGPNVNTHICRALSSLLATILVVVDSVVEAFIMILIKVLGPC